MIELDKVKVALWDFDDTLCIHYHHGSSKEETHKYNLNVFKYGTKAWDGCKPSKTMKGFIDVLKEKGIKQGLISATTSAKHMNSKVEWVLENYGIELENYCVSSFEEKLEMMITIADALSIKREEILIIDDYWENLERAANNGFQACSPMEIVLMFE